MIKTKTVKSLLLPLLILSSMSYGQTERYSLRAHLDYSESNRITVGGHEDFRSTFNLGVEVRRRMGQKGFYLQSGIRWNEFGFASLMTSYIWNGVTHVGQVDYYRSTHFFVSIPCIATWKCQKKLTGVTFSLGPQLSFLILRKSKYDNETNFYSDREIHLSGHFSIGYERPLNDKWLIGAEVISNAVIPDGFYNFGIGIHANYILK